MSAMFVIEVVITYCAGNTVRGPKRDISSRYGSSRIQFNISFASSPITTERKMYMIDTTGMPHHANVMLSMSSGEVTILIIAKSAWTADHEVHDSNVEMENTEKRQTKHNDPLMISDVATRRTKSDGVRGDLD